MLTAIPDRVRLFVFAYQENDTVHLQEQRFQLPAFSGYLHELPQLAARVAGRVAAPSEVCFLLCSDASQLSLILAAAAVPESSVYMVSPRQLTELLPALSDESNVSQMLSALELFFLNTSNPTLTSIVGRWRRLGAGDVQACRVYSGELPWHKHPAARFVDFCRPADFTDDEVVDLLKFVFDPRDHRNPAHPDSLRQLYRHCGIEGSAASNAAFDMLTQVETADKMEPTALQLLLRAWISRSDVQQSYEMLCGVPRLDFLFDRPLSSTYAAWLQHGCRVYLTGLTAFWLHSLEDRPPGCELFVPGHFFQTKEDLNAWSNFKTDCDR